MAGRSGAAAGCGATGELPLNAGHQRHLAGGRGVRAADHLHDHGADDAGRGGRRSFREAEARPLTAKEGMVVSVDRQGRIFVDQTPVSYNDFRVTFRSLVAQRKPASVYLRADTRVPYGDVVRVLAVIRASGVRDVGLVAEEEESRAVRMQQRCDNRPAASEPD